MKIILRRSLILLSYIMITIFVSCKKDDLITETQKVDFPDGETEGVLDVKTIFNMDKLDATIIYSNENKLDDEYSEALTTLESISTGNNDCKVCFYQSTLPSGSTSLVPNGDISVIVSPDIQSLKQIDKSSDIDLDSYADNDLIAISNYGDICQVTNFIEDDIIGSLNGLVKWINSYSEQKRITVNGYSEANTPDAEKLFRSFIYNATVPFELKDKEVAAVVCSKKDYQSGKGSYEVHYTVLPLHAFDDQAGAGDYYYVKGNFVLNSTGMYKGNYTSKHGGVTARICAFFAKVYTFRSFMSDKSGNVVGNFVDRGTPAPGTTIGSKTFSTGMSWNIGGSLTGGVKSDAPMGTVSVSGGISVSNSESTTISDFQCKLDASNSIAKYVNDFKNLPYYEDLEIHVPSKTCIATISFPFAYIIKIDGVKDNSTECFNINFCLDQLVYDHCRFYSSSADMKWIEWNIKDMTEPQKVQAKISCPIKNVNRTPTGVLKIYHDTNKFGRYIYSITATKEGSKPLTFDKKTCDVGGTLRQYIPTGNWKITMKVGESLSTAQDIVSVSDIQITRADSTQILTGANFQKAQ